jgi:hypothetical protein
MNMQHNLGVLALAVALGAAQATTTISPTHHHAYGANAGWIDARGDVAHGAVVGQHFCTGSMWGANVGWIGLGNGPANGWSYSNASATDWGVNHDGAGNLVGYAYGANIGWISFEQTYGQPKVDLLTGSLSGYAWGANVGWISLANSQALVRTDTLDAGPDSDGDNLPDAWEYEVAGSLTTLDPLDDDSDDDGVPDTDEYLADTDPLDASSQLRITAFSRDVDTDAATWPVAVTRLYRLVQADSLTPSPPGWTDSGHGLMLPGGGPDLTKQVVDPAATQRFYRVQAVVPLTP